MPYTNVSRPPIVSPGRERTWRSTLGPPKRERIAAKDCEPADVRKLSDIELGQRLGLARRTIYAQRRSGWVKSRVDFLDANGWTDGGDASLTKAGESVPWQLLLAVLDEWSENQTYSINWIAWNLGFSDRSVDRWRRKDRVPVEVIDSLFDRMARAELPEGRTWDEATARTR